MAHFAAAGLKHGRRLSVDGLSAVRSDGDKLDFKELDLTSPAAFISANTSSSSSTDSNHRRRPGHARSHSVSSATSHVFPSGNIYPSGRIEKPAPAAPARGVALPAASSAAGNIQAAGVAVMARRAIASGDPEEVRRVGNEQYKRGNFAEALGLYDRAIAMAPDDAVCRSNRAAALIGLGRLPEAVAECELAIGLDPLFGRAHRRLASLLLRLGQVENARKHLLTMQCPDPINLAKLRGVEKHFTRCIEARRTGDWKSALREGDAAIAAGADSSPQLIALRAESLLKLHQLVDADLAISNIPRYEFSSSCTRSKFCGMLSDSYPFFVRALVEMAMGRFENAVVAAEKAGQFDSCNTEIVTVIKNIKSVTRARVQGNDLFNAGRYHDACRAYGDGLKLDPCNPLLFCNRAACRYKLGQWDKAIDDCNEALRIRPNYSKALLKRAACYEKLDKWDESVRDYKILRKELPKDLKVADALFHAQVSLKNSWGKEVHNMKFGGEVEEISGLDPFKAAVSSAGIYVVYFMMPSNIQCQQISPIVDQLCAKYPSLNFLKVNVDNNPSLAHADNVKTVPTVKIYKNGAQVKEMICPNQQVLEYTVRHYGL